MYHLKCERTDVSVSNVFTAWRIEALRSMGGFSRNTIVNEDRYTASRLLLGGWKVAYCAESQVRFSKGRSSWDCFRRAFDTGVFSKTAGRSLGVLAPSELKGWRHFFAELSQLWIYEPVLIPYAIFHATLKYSAYRLGRFHRYLPQSLKRFFSTQKYYWQENTRQVGQSSVCNPQYDIELMSKKNALSGAENWQTNWISDLNFPLKSKSSYKKNRVQETSASQPFELEK